MVPKTLKQLQEARAAVAELEQVVAEELNQELAQLHESYGFADVETFVIAIREATGGRQRRGRRGPRGRKAVAAEGGPRRGRRRRAKITAAMRGEVKRLAKQGKTGREIAAEVGISLPSVQNIKKEAGLVKARGGTKAKVKDAPKPKVTKTKRRGKKRAAKAPAAKSSAPEAAAPKSE